MADSTIPAVIDGLRSTLAARAGLSGVSVRSSPIEPRKQGIELIRVEEDQDFAALGTNTPRDERYAIIGHIWTTGKGSSESAVKTVRDRAFSYLKEIADYLRDTPRLGIDEVVSAHLNVVNMTQGWVSTESSNCELRFRIQVHARI